LILITIDCGILSAPNCKNAQVLTIDGMGVSAVLLSGN
jgi:hypothetical protein